MVFERSEREVFARNPLAEVVCQIRFPTLLELDQRAPIELQRALRNVFPQLEVRQEYWIAVRVAGGEAPPGPAPPVRNVYDFLSADGTCKATVTSNFIALTATTYRVWSDFRSALEMLLVPFVQTYEPFSFDRIGLRYVNKLHLAPLGLVGASATDLFNSQLVGSLQNFQGVVSKLATRVELEPTDDSGVTLQFAVNRDEGIYTVDTDFHTRTKAEADVANALRLVDKFNVEAGNAFRWAVSERVKTLLRAPP